MSFNLNAIDWKAVWIGFAVGLVVAVLGEGTAIGEMILPDSSGYILAGLVGGFVAGFVSGGPARVGAYTGGIASVAGGLVILGVLAVVTALFSGIVVSAALLVLGGVLLGIYAIPGAIGGVIGAAVNSRRTGGETAT